VFHLFISMIVVTTDCELYLYNVPFNARSKL
jgi:hypothetical protein